MAATYRVVLSPAALDAMRDIYFYVRNELCMPSAAEDLFDALMDAVLSLESMPKRCRIMAEEPMQAAGVRRLNVRKYSFFYLVDDDHGIVNVFTLLFGASSPARLRDAYKEHAL